MAHDILSLLSTASLTPLIETMCLHIVLSPQSTDPLGPCASNTRTHCQQYLSARMSAVPCEALLFCIVQWFVLLSCTVLRFAALCCAGLCRFTVVSTSSPSSLLSSTSSLNIPLHTSYSEESKSSGTAAERVFFHVLMVLVSPSVRDLSSRLIYCNMHSTNLHGLSICATSAVLVRGHASH